MVPYSAAYYFSYDWMKSKYRDTVQRQQLTVLETLVIGGLAGVLSSACTFPLEVARKKVIVSSIGNRMAYRNLVHAMTETVREGGVQSLYRGLTASSLKVFPSSALGWASYEKCKKVLRVDEPEEDEGRGVGETQLAE
jgi:hypothetical protein